MKRAIAAVSALIGVCIAQAAPAQELVTLRYGQNAAGVSGLSSLPLNVAMRKDYFRLAAEANGPTRHVE